jgi:hypothetical protein
MWLFVKYCCHASNLVFHLFFALTVSIRWRLLFLVFLQSISDVSAINPLDAFDDIHGGKREVLFFYFVPDTIRDTFYNVSYHIHCKTNPKCNSNDESSPLIVIGFNYNKGLFLLYYEIYYCRKLAQHDLYVICMLISMLARHVAAEAVSHSLYIIFGHFYFSFYYNTYFFTASPTISWLCLK